MMLSKSIYVSGITNLSDARYCAGMGVDYLGVCLDDSSGNYLSLETFTEIKNWLVGVDWVAESASADAAELMDKLREYDLDLLCTPHPEVATDLIIGGIRCSLKVNELANVTAQKYEFIVLNLPKVQPLPNVSDEMAEKVYLDGNFSIDDLQIIKNDFKGKGVVLEGGDELRPGFKDMDELINQLEVFETE